MRNQLMITPVKTATALLELAEAVASRIPANPNAPQHMKLAEKFRLIMAKYFDSLADAFPYHRLDAVYNRYVKESPGADSANIMDPILAQFDKTLKATVSGQIAEIYLSGSAEMITWGQTMAGIPIAYEGPPISQAISWAEKEGSRLVTQMTEETQRRIAHTVSQGIETKRGVPGLARDIRNMFGDMTKYRSELIAKTETRQALFSASHDRMEEMGISGKEWVLGAGGVSGNCDDCIMNAAVGIIPLQDEFPIPEGSIHPGCTCSIAPARLPK